MTGETAKEGLIPLRISLLSDSLRKRWRPSQRAVSSILHRQRKLPPIPPSLFPIPIPCVCRLVVASGGRMKDPDRDSGFLSAPNPCGFENGSSIQRACQPPVEQIHFLASPVWWRNTYTSRRINATAASSFRPILAPCHVPASPAGGWSHQT